MEENSSQHCDFVTKFFVLALGILLVIRLLATVLTPLNIGPDEAQYWRWGKSFDWGYYSKPPITAWLIGLSTSVFGDGEWSVRFLSPVLHTLTAWLLFLTGRRLRNTSTGILAASAYYIMPAVSLSSVIMSTDVPLLACWSAGLFSLFWLREAGSWKASLCLGLTIGLGFLSKYAMIYFLIGLAFACLDRKTRQQLFTLKGAGTLVMAALVILPHILWNMQNGFETVSHTADNANWQSDLFHPDMALKFFIDQFGVFGPVSFGLLLFFFIWGLLGRTRFFQERSEARILTGFILPPLLIILVQAFISRAHANWAATAYPGAALLMALWAGQAQGWLKRVFLGGIGLNLFVGAIFSILIMLPLSTQIALGAGNASKRVRGWPETIAAVQSEVQKLDPSAIIVDERELWHGLDYYGRDGVISTPIRAWRRQPEAKSFSEEVPISVADSERALVLSFRKDEQDKMAADFDSFEPIGEIRIDLGGNRYRPMYLFLAHGFCPVYGEE